ncbi:helix-turn-helix domain-containing protein [Heliorestis convoluta]|nr:helix-turn-helix transcriptional regulator [Heliorestis convoluta]
MIATRLRTVREQSGLTQAELAEKAGVSPGLIGQLEQGKVQPSLRTIERISEVLGVTPCYFLVPQPSLDSLLH